MRIQLVAPRYRPDLGGVETHVERLATHTARRGHEVEVVTQSGDPGLPAVETVDGVHVRRFRVAVRSQHYPVAPGLWRHLSRTARGFDVVHAHNYHAVPALAAARSSPAGIVFTPHYHGTSASAFRRLLHRPYRHAGRRIIDSAGAVICVSRLESDLLVRHFPAAGDRITVIPNGVEMQMISAAQPMPVQRTVLLSAGRLEAYKRVDRIVEVLAHLDGSFVLRITGDGPERAAIARRVSELGLEGRVELLGRVDDDELRRWFRTARVYVTMSTIEAMPITPLEVLAGGARVVATDIDAHREIAEVTGGSMTLVPPEIDSAGLARAIERAAGETLRDPSILSWGEVATATLELYARVSRSPV